MSDWKILIADGLNENGKAILRAAAQVDDRAGISAEELLAEIGAYHALVLRGRTRASAALMEAGSRLKVIGRAGVGVDNIDLAAASNRNIRVVNAPLSTTLAVAEHTLALLLALARALPRADAGMKSGLWLKKDMEGVELYGRVLGIVGLGNIGAAVAARAAAFGMSVLAYDALIPAEVIRQRGAEPAALNDLFAGADFISLHAPLGPETRNMINGQTLGLMKRGVRLICAARGGLIDETALLGALESGHVAGAALDVYAKEPPGLTALVAHPNVVATPHIAAQTAEAQARAAADIAHEVLAALHGEPLRWKVV
ncbi:MAG: hydroxyacid dehydrogenase [Chloroflexi bacterium]|nr:hydroxyacid dehydrogenase [Chloroflexota bacterium]